MQKHTEIPLVFPTQENLSVWRSSGCKEKCDSVAGEITSIKNINKNNILKAEEKKPKFNTESYVDKDKKNIQIC